MLSFNVHTFFNVFTEKKIRKYILKHLVCSNTVKTNDLLFFQNLEQFENNTENKLRYNETNLCS